MKGVDLSALNIRPYEGDRSDEHARDGILGDLLAYQWRSVEVCLPKRCNLHFLVALLTFELDKAPELHFGGVHRRLETTRT